MMMGAGRFVDRLNLLVAVANQNILAINYIVYWTLWSDEAVKLNLFFSYLELFI